MGVLRNRSPWEREFQEVWRKEQWFLRRYDEKRETVIDRKITEIAPEKLIPQPPELKSHRKERRRSTWNKIKSNFIRKKK